MSVYEEKPARLVDWITEMANGEPVEAVVIGDLGGYHYPDDDEKVQPPRGVLLSWDEAVPHISYEFDDGYGSAGCHAIIAWTASRVISVSEYDGSTCPFWMPRNPTPGVPGMPGMPGGG